MLHPAEPSSPDPFATERLSGTQRRLFGRKYRIVGQIGKGGMADVFLSAAAGPFDVSKPVVIKTLQKTAREDPTISRMFLDEARLASRLNHANIVHTYDVGEDSGTLFLAMEYLEGKTLGQLCGALAKTRTRVDVAMACHIVVEVLEGLDHAHELCDHEGRPLDIVHRDVSPQNVFVTFDGRVKILDFGIAKTTSGNTETEPGILKGKVRYMAPEQATGSKVDRRADVFSCGVLLWELLTGERLRSGETTEVLLRIVSQDAPHVSAWRPDIDPELDQIVAVALSRNRDARFRTAAEMAKTLTDYLSRRALAVRSSDVVAMLNTVFPGAREESRRRLDGWMHGQASTPLVFGPTETGPAPTFGSGVSAQDRPLGRFVVAGLIVAALLAGVWFLLGWHSSAPATATAGSSPSGVAAANAGPAGAESFHLSLNSNPVQSDIEWNGGPIGQTPLMLDLEPGSHVFMLQHEGFHPATVVVSVTSHMGGTTESRTVTMVPIGKDEKGAARPAWATAAPQAKVGPIGPLPVVAAPQSSPERSTSAETTSSPGPANAPAATATLDTAAAPPAAAAPAATATATPTPTVLAYGPDMPQPRLLSAVDPVFPREAIVAKVEGTVIAKCTITTSGSLEGCRIIKGLPFMDRPMLDALSRRRYAPIIYKGSPVAVQYVFSTHIVRP
jgi:serine/threonine protein kinase/outer membrane biosynthesis protein TonB